MYDTIFIYYLQGCPSGKDQQYHDTSTFNNLSWNSGGKFRAVILFLLPWQILPAQFSTGCI